jgi:pimeloyl-ACP methyl ester carboxylesterase
MIFNDHLRRTVVGRVGTAVLALVLIAIGGCGGDTKSGGRDSAGKDPSDPGGGTTDPAELAAAFYNPAVSDAKFLELTGTRNPDRLKTMIAQILPSHASAIFAQRATVASFDHTPAEYGVVHAVNYYIPSSFKADAPAPLLVILHGGGSSTDTYEDARDTSRIYMNSFIGFAERNGVILLGPSSRLGWSYIGRILVRQCVDLAKRELAIDPNRIYVWGHSMGAMGITREGHWLVDVAAALMPNAGGMQDEFRIDPFLRTYFDTRMVHMQGLQDHFPEFVTRTRAVESRMKALETMVGERSGYAAIFEPRAHDFDLNTVVAMLEHDVLSTRRNIYQERIFPLVERLDARNNPLGPNVNAYVQNRYLWIEAPNLVSDLPRKEFDQGRGENFVAFEARVASNTYDITIDDRRVSMLRVLVSNRMVDLGRPVVVKVNGTELFRGIVSPDPLRIVTTARSHKDRAFLFENAIDVMVPPVSSG